MSKDSSARIPNVNIHRQVDKLCDEIEMQWASGQSPDTASIVESLDKDVVPYFLRELIQLEVDLRRQSIPSLRERYKKVLPNQSPLLEDIFEELERSSVDTNVATSLIDRNPIPAHIENFVGKKIGQYKIEKRLGGGGFGVVYLAKDAYLPRNVVIKIPILGSMATDDGVETFMNEARNAALLRHPNILSVLHVGVDSSLPYIVQEYFEGGDLDQSLRQRKFSIEETVDFVATLSDAIGYAHEYKIVHRDLKPANILIDKEGKPVIADFGLSLHEPRLRGQEGEMVGTIRFMSPEQVRGEAHRLDGRTDIWSIGVILYLMLVDQYPFDGKDIQQISDAILFGRPYPPRQLDASISEELNRISLRCLSVRVSDRYSTAFDLAEDLRSFSRKEFEFASSQMRVSDEQIEKKRLIPKGLSAFDTNDSDFFLELLPGPKDRNGIPDSIRFWKDRIENPDLSNPVSLLFGPSGSGKSSLVHAGLLPVLDSKIVTVTVEATANDTEVRLLKAIRAEIPSLPDDPLPVIISEIRRGNFLPSNRRLLIVIDQFEQWLHANPELDGAQIVHALRQCDGGRVQVLILARDDFWMAITRFFRHLEIDLVERKNFASVDLFSKRHAKNVLIQFGQAYGNLPDNLNDISDSQNLFIDKAIDLLSDENSVICVRSALFAETVKNREWEIETLKKLGNAKNIGIEFLDQNLGDQSNNPIYKFYREKLIAILESLLPSTGVEIKGNLQSIDSLAETAGFESNDPEFEKVIKILDNELRLITPTEPDVGHSDSPSAESYYQLTHDYLVPSIREWIETERGRTIQGRSLQKLNELSEQWHQSQDSRFLPGLLEYGSMMWNIPRRMITARGKKFLGQATKYFGIRFLGLFVFFAAVALIAGLIAASQNKITLVSQQLLSCKPGELLSLTGEIGNSNNSSYAKRIRQQIENGLSPTKERRAKMVLAMMSQATEDDIRYLIDKIPDTQDAESKNLNEGLSKDSELSCRLIEDALLSNPRHRDKLLIQLAHLNPERSLVEKLGFYEDPSDRSEFIHEYKSWRGNMSKCLDMLKAERTPAELHGLCIMLGQLSPDEFDSDEFDDLTDFVSKLYQHPSSAVHGAARWALTRWQIGLPEVDPSSQVNTRQWWINALDMTMIKVNQGKIPSDWRKSDFFIERDFFISQFEITNELFRKYLDDPKSEKYSGFELPDSVVPDAAVVGLAIEDAVLFCNWLSDQCELDAAYKIADEERNDNGDNASPSIPKWELIPDSNGYRIPILSQWEMAARGGVARTTTYFSDETFFVGLSDYLWCRQNSKDEIQPVGVKIPNQLGLFDILGNAYELSYDERYMGCFGGSYESTVVNCCIFSGVVGVFTLKYGERRTFAGFRVVLPAK